FLEVNNGLWVRGREAARRVAARLARRPYAPPLRVPATALVAMLPGKASPLVFGGKIHTPRDTPDRVYPGPLRETLLILDYFFHRLDGGARVGEPRNLDEFHYARLYRAAAGHLLALKDAVEPNRRNVNGVYRVTATVEGKRGIAAVQSVVRNWIFLTFFALAWVLAQVFGWALDVAFSLSTPFALWVAEHTVLTLVAVVAVEIAILLYMMARRIPTWIDNAYRHENRADNLGSLRRVRDQTLR